MANSPTRPPFVEDRFVRNRRRARRLVHAIWITGLVLPSALGAIVRTVLAAHGEKVVSWSVGIGWILPLTIVFAIPFCLLALIAGYVLETANGSGPQTFQRSLWICAGAFAGLTVKLGHDLSGALLNIEHVAHLVVFWPISVPLVSAEGAIGAVGGAGVGWLGWNLLGRKSDA